MRTALVSVVAFVIVSSACGRPIEVRAPDAGAEDSGADAGVDSGTPTGEPDAGEVFDSGSDAGLDAGAGDAGNPDAGSAMDSGVVTTSTSYMGWSRTRGDCSVSESLLISEPAGAGPFPVFLYTVGTGAIVSSEEAELAAREMAGRGFVAVVVQYETAIITTGCINMLQKADCAYAPNRVASAVSVICARGKADCDRGIVVAGLSQGATMAILAANYEPRVRAAWVMAFGGGSATNLATQCFVDAATALPADRLRVINGRFGQAMPVSNLQEAAGTSCADTDQSCFAANGSGWYMVENSQVQDGHADHCYFVGPGPDGGEVGCSNSAVDFDIGWKPPASDPWSLAINLDWLATFAGP